MALKDLIQINSRLKMDLWNLIEIDWRLKKLPEFWFKSTHDSNSRILVTIRPWLNLFGLSIQLTSPTNWFESAHGSSSISETWIDSTHYPTTSQELTLNQVMTQADSQVLIQIDSCFKIFPIFRFKSTHRSSKKSFFLFWTDKWFDSESYQCLAPASLLYLYSIKS